MDCLHDSSLTKRHVRTCFSLSRPSRVEMEVEEESIPRWFLPNQPQNQPKANVSESKQLDPSTRKPTQKRKQSPVVNKDNAKPTKLPSADTLVLNQKTKSSPSAGDDGKLNQQLLNNNKFAKLANKRQGNVDGTTSSKTNPAPVVTPAESTSGKQKQPPLVVKNTDFATLIDKMELCIAKPVYKITRFGIKLLCASTEDFNLVKEHLIKNGLEFYSHDRPNQRPFRVVLRGLPVIDPKALVTCLKEQYNLVAQAAHIIQRKGECAALDEKFHLVSFEKGHTNLKKLSAVTTIAQIVVRWEAYRNKRADATQCLNCLYHGHGTRNCYLKRRCNHCGEAHASDTCPKKEAPEKKCANCHGAHPATDRSCPKRAEYIRIRQQATVANQPGRRNISRGPPALTSVEFPPLPSATATPGPSTSPFGSSAWCRNRPTEPRARVETQNGDPSAKETDKMPLFSAAECWAIFTEFCGRLQQCKSRSDQISVIGDMAFKYGVK